MKKFKVRLIKEDKEAYGGDLGRHGGGGRVRMSQSLKKGDTVQFQVADYRTNTRKYYKGIVMMLKGEKGYQRVVSDRAQVKVTHEADQTYRSSHDQAGTITDFVPVPEPYITEISADELVAVNEAVTEADTFKDVDDGVETTVSLDIDAKAAELAALPEDALKQVVQAAMQLKRKQESGNRQDEAFRDSAEEEEMMKKMPNKELYRYMTRDRDSRQLSDEEIHARDQFNNWLNDESAKDHWIRQKEWEPAQNFPDGRVLAYRRAELNRKTGKFQEVGEWYDVMKDIGNVRPPGNRKDVTEAHCGSKNPGNRRIKVRRKK